ncbi:MULTISPECIES: S-layer homology domain-containing protein [unclassified Paenibacillus]|uniref:S-layer homology domain-containing protein n=1 Tax=unclassified Paenibacillus TaxID=185978 RepID=UPI0027834E2A|nr:MULTISPECIES: S-layer homology domain-containing protein [unclassified Paenibacillus]MDQ0896439.1 hypothetical protein [Paenibacillus sp. V4I7]MDQ0914017.1 hypothetical protein [Paenibacillus sp. V4I5]
MKKLLNMKKKFLTVSAGVLLLSALNAVPTLADKVGASKVTLTDIGNHWGKTAIETAISKGYVEGYEDNSFRPERQVSRAEFIKMISVAIGLKSDPVKSDNWYDVYIKNMKDAGILWGSFNTNKMNDAITRSEMASISVHAVDINSPRATMLEATTMGLIQGRSDGALDEDGTTTRAESVTIVERVLTKRSGNPLPIDKDAVAKAEVMSTGTNIKSVLGLKPMGLGERVAIAQGVSAKIEKVIIIDPSNLADPYMNLIDLAIKPPFSKLEDNYVVSVQLRVLVDSTANKDSSISVMQNFSLQDASGLVVSTNPLRSPILFKQSAEYIGWVSAYYPKNNIKNGIGFDISGHQVILGSPN